MAVIEVEHLHKIFYIPHEKRNTLFETLTGLLRPSAYETFHALKDISFSVEEGEMLGVIGQNGSGKSTLLKIISRILIPTEGSVITRKTITPFLELGVGFNTPGIIRYPFETMVFRNRDAVLIRINRDHPECIKENLKSTISFNEDMNKVINDLIAIV